MYYNSYISIVNRGKIFVNGLIYINMMDKEIFLKLGQKVRFERIRRNLSQEDLATKANINTRSISALECGPNDVKVSTLVSIAEAFKMNVKDLFDFKL